MKKHRKQQLSSEHLGVYLFAWTAILLAAVLGYAIVLGESEEPEFVSNSHGAVEERATFPSKGKAIDYGVYFANGRDTVASINGLLGNKLKIFGVFEPWNTSGLRNSTKIGDVCAANYVPFITWESWGGKSSNVEYDLLAISEGTHDDHINTFLDGIKGLCKDKPVLVRFDHEMEMRPGYGSPWSPWQGKPTEYVRAWRYITQYADNYPGVNIRWVWSPNRGDEYIIPYYPGDEYVDYVGVTLNHPTITGNVYDNFEEFYTPNKAALEQFNKPIIIGEAAYNNTNVDTYQDWITSAFSYVDANENIVAIIWFNQEFEHVDYGVTTNQSSIEIFKHSLERYAR